MGVLRRQLGVLVMVVLSGHAATLASAAAALGCLSPVEVAGEGDCCPPGSHADGMCPMQAAGRAAHSQNDPVGTDCRLVCANRESGLLVLLQVAVSPPQPLLAGRTSATELLVTGPRNRLIVRFATPPSPPPRD